MAKYRDVVQKDKEATGKEPFDFMSWDDIEDVEDSGEANCSHHCTTVCIFYVQDVLRSNITFETVRILAGLCCENLFLRFHVVQSALICAKKTNVTYCHIESYYP